MHIVAITQWGKISVGQTSDYQVFAFPDLDTINRPIAETKDLALALQEVAGSLYDYQKEVISTKRNQSNDAWLALCKKVE
jgi:hypothetical protein|tara:strand:- start:1903 stop:2142 length:240 start_codon:yes stop_codon:yes gene_type:complete